MRWLLGNKTQVDLDPGTGRTFRHKHSWCWNVQPVIDPTGEIFDEIQVDGIYLRSGWCCLIAIAHGHVIAWQWCDTEKTVAWKALLAQIPPPTVVVCDGGTGLHAALRELWPDTLIQRCLVHVVRNVRTYLTSRPRTPAGQALWAITKQLTKIRTPEQATDWLVTLQAWFDTFGELTKQRTYLTQVAAVPGWIRPGQRWWFTHDRLRKAYRILERLTRDDHLFTFLNPEVDSLGIASTTNHIEGGVNAQLRDLLRRHRGMTQEHQRRAVEWWLYCHSHEPEPPRSLIMQTSTNNQVITTAPQEPIGPELYGTGTSAEEGLWARKGWAGRS